MNLDRISYVSNSSVNVLFGYIETRSLNTDEIADMRDPIEMAVWSYLASRHLQTARIEVFDMETDITAIEWFDLTIERVSPYDPEKRPAARFNQYREEVATQLQALNSLPSSVNYRILLGITSENDLGQESPSLGGWAKTTPRNPPESANEHDKHRQCDLTWLEHIQ
ncbi:hypothetical protein [Halorientalis regularis]|uniref:Bacterial HORMA domain-containing protein n=1 Tax=Halorientalis regularis TaxID=660518 RepID=A0A1G7R9B4_9EURY|nr:hypothetical protein [Halorientalis regularis]SDG07391.1 hypothetical protein SAMN05216218_114112 [Halorientalis regularis]